MKNTVVIMQENEQFSAELAAFFKSGGEFDVVGTATDGIRGMALVRKHNPAFIIVDILLSGMDGLAVLESIREEGLSAKPIILTSMMRDEIAERATDYGARYILIKPCSFAILTSRMKQMQQRHINEAARIEAADSLEDRINRIMMTAGFSPKIKGFYFLREGIRLASENPEVMESVTGKLYPMISAHFGSTDSRVERGIRHALDVAWSKGNLNVINQLFGFPCVRRTRPTNREFIALISDRMQVERAR